MICAPCLKAARKKRKHPNKNCGCPCQHRIIKDRNDYIKQEPK